MKNFSFLGLIAIFSLMACPVQEPIDNEFNIGKNYFSSLVDDDIREYYVYVPSGYDENIPVPVVFMLHGTSGNGEKFYNISGWKEVGEEENIITVYPSSWRYCVIDDGEVKNTTKWNVYPGTYEFCENEIPRDDIKFLRQIISELNQRFNVDNTRMYLAGFSNGGQMAFRCAVEMSDVFGAIVESAGACSRDTIFNPLRDIPITFQLGNSDDKWFGPDVEIPLSSFESTISGQAGFNGMIATHANSFNFESSYTISGDTTTALIATYKGIPDQGNRHFKVVFIKDLGHNYPNGINHPIKGAELNWEWMKQYTIP